MAQTETASYFRILPNLPAACAGNKGLALHLEYWVGIMEGEERRGGETFRKISICVTESPLQKIKDCRKLPHRGALWTNSQT